MKKYYILISIFLFIAVTIFGQTTDLVKSDRIVSQIHLENVGKVAFMKENIEIENLKQSDFLTVFKLKEKTDLNISVFLENSLTNYLHLLLPKLSTEELTKHGNYQFTFKVDDKVIYIENIHTGAGTVDSKNQKTAFRVPLISTKNEDSWGRYLWDRFLMNGGQEAFVNEDHLLKIEIRPYLKVDKLLVGNIIAQGQIKIIVPKIKVNERLIKIQPIKPLKDWEIASEIIDTLKIEELNSKILSNTYKNVTSIVVIKNGKLLIEEYFNGATRKSLHDTRSVGKSFASTILGIAIRDGYIKDEMQFLNETYNLKDYKNYSKEKDSITLKDLLTMSSTFEGNDMNSESLGNEENMYPTNNWVKFSLDLPIDNSKVKEKRWDYFTAGVVVLGDIIHKSVPDGLAGYADKNVFQPLGITSYKWQFTPQKVASTAGGLQLRSLDYAKFGLLYKQKGIWKNKQILTEKWVNKSLSRQIRISENEYYGYLFWNKIYTFNDKNYEVYYSSGNGGNKIFIFKDQPLIIVVTSTAYNKPYAHTQVDKIMQEYLIPAVTK